MAFSVKIVPGDHANEVGECRVYLQAIIDRKRAVVPMSFYVDPECFDKRRQSFKKHANAKD